MEDRQRKKHHAKKKSKRRNDSPPPRGASPPPSLRPYTIPKTGSKELFASIPLESREGREIIKNINNTLWDANSISLEILKLELVQNGALEAEYASKRKEMREHSRSTLETSDSYGFLVFRNIAECKKACCTGIERKSQYLPNDAACYLGDKNYGVYLCRCADIIKRSPLWSSKLDVIMLVCKFMKGRLKSVQEQASYSDGISIEPTPEFDGHTSKNFQRGKKWTHDRIYNSSQIYLYEIDFDNFSEKDDSAIYAKRPRHCLPYAIATFRAKQKTQQQQVISKPIPSEHHAQKGVPVTQTAEQTNLQGVDFEALSQQRMKYIWQGCYYNCNKQLANIQIGVYCSRAIKLPIEGAHLCITQQISIEKLSKIFPPKIFRKPPVCSGVPYETVENVKFLHAEIHPVTVTSAKVEMLHKHWLKSNYAGVCTLASGLKLFIIPTGDFTESLGITGHGYPAILHCVFMRQFLNSACIFDKDNEQYPKFKKMVNNCVRDRIGHSEELKHIHSGIILSAKKYGYKPRERMTVVSAYSKVRKAFDKNISEKAGSNSSNRVRVENNDEHQAITSTKDTPIILPRGIPSALPKDISSALPKEIPSALPKEIPSALPKEIPSALPKEIPSALPKDIPSILPRGIPSTLPKDIPSALPKDIPSALPKDITSALSNDISSALPKDIPSALPKDIPSALPKEIPSALPKEISNPLPMDTPDVLSRAIPSTTQIAQSTNTPDVCSEPSNKNIDSNPISFSDSQARSMSDMLFSSPSVQLFRETKPEMFAMITGQNPITDQSATSNQSPTTSLSATTGQTIQNQPVNMVADLAPSTITSDMERPELLGEAPDDIASDEQVPSSYLTDSLPVEKVTEKESEKEGVVKETAPRKVESIRSVQEKVYRKSVASSLLSMMLLSEETSGKEIVHEQNERQWRDNFRRRDDSRDRYSSRSRGKEWSRDGDRDHDRSRDRSKNSHESRARSRKDAGRWNDSLSKDSSLVEKMQKKFTDLENVYKDKYNIDSEQERKVRSRFRSHTSKMTKANHRTEPITEPINQIVGDIPFLETSQDETDDHLIIDTDSQLSSIEQTEPNKVAVRNNGPIDEEKAGKTLQDINDTFYEDSMSVTKTSFNDTSFEDRPSFSPVTFDALKGEMRNVAATAFPNKLLETSLQQDFSSESELGNIESAIVTQRNLRKSITEQENGHEESMEFQLVDSLDEHVADRTMHRSRDRLKESHRYRSRSRDYKSQSNESRSKNRNYRDRSRNRSRERYGSSKHASPSKHRRDSPHRMNNRKDKDRSKSPVPPANEPEGKSEESRQVTRHKKSSQPPSITTIEQKKSESRKTSPSGSKSIGYETRPTCDPRSVSWKAAAKRRTEKIHEALPSSSDDEDEKDTKRKLRKTLSKESNQQNSKELPPKPPLLRLSDCVSSDDTDKNVDDLRKAFGETVKGNVGEPIIDFRLSRDQKKETQQQEPSLPKQKRNKHTIKTKRKDDSIRSRENENIANKSKFHIVSSSTYNRSVTPPLEMLMFPQRQLESGQILSSLEVTQNSLETTNSDISNLLNLPPKHSIRACSLKEWSEKLPHSTLDDFCEQIISSIDKVLA